MAELLNVDRKVTVDYKGFGMNGKGVEGIFFGDEIIELSKVYARFPELKNLHISQLNFLKTKRKKK